MWTTRHSLTTTFDDWQTNWLKTFKATEAFIWELLGSNHLKPYSSGKLWRSNRIVLLYLYYPTAGNTVQTWTNIQRYCIVIFTVENLFAVQIGARTRTLTLSRASYIDKFIDYSIWIINPFWLDVLVCSIAVYFYDLCRILTSPLRRVKIQTTSKNIQRYYTQQNI